LEESLNDDDGVSDVDRPLLEEFLNVDDDVLEAHPLVMVIVLDSVEEFLNVDGDVNENHQSVMENDDDDVIENLFSDVNHLLGVVKDFSEEYLLSHFLYV
jgi:hypothetical protein